MKFNLSGTRGVSATTQKPVTLILALVYVINSRGSKIGRFEDNTDFIQNMRRGRERFFGFRVL